MNNFDDHDNICKKLEGMLAGSGLPDTIQAPPYPENNTFSPGAEIFHVEPEEAEQGNDIYLVWEAVSWSHKDCYVFYVLKWLIGQASDFMEGGPGRGMHCRAVYMINHDRNILEINTIFKLYKTTGVFGLHYKVEPKSIASMSAHMLYQIATLAETITEEELMRAKNSQALKVGINLERKLERSVEQIYNLLVGNF